MNANRPLRQNLQFCNLETAVTALQGDLSTFGEYPKELREALLNLRSQTSLLFNTPEQSLMKSREHCIKEFTRLRSQYFDVIKLPPNVSRLSHDELEKFKGYITLAAPLNLQLGIFNKIHFDEGAILEIRGNPGSIDIILSEEIIISIATTEMPSTGILIKQT